MSVTATTIAIPPQVFGYSTVGGRDIALTNAPRGEVIFNAKGEAVTVAGSGNEQLCSLNMTLPANFTYALVDFFVNLSTATDIADWDDHAFVIFNERRQTSPSFLTNMIARSDGVFDADPAIPNFTARTWELPCKPKALFSPSQDFPSPNMVVQLVNNVQDGEVGSLTTYIRFLQYDIAQHHSVGVNLPMLTR